MHNGGPRHSRESRYLLPGLARCAMCNGGLHVRTRTRAKGSQLRTYACSSLYHRGASVCTNYVQVPMEATDEKVLRSIRNVLRPYLAEIVIAGVRDELERVALTDPRGPLLEELAALDGQIANLADAIAMGGNLAALVQRLRGPRNGASASKQRSRRLPLPPSYLSLIGRLRNAEHGDC
jgi:hypothetical protein